MGGRQDRETPPPAGPSDTGRPLDSTRQLTVADGGSSDPGGVTEPAVAPWSVGRYLVIDEIGVGGMGRVYRAYDPKLSREVAVKCLKIRSATGSVGSARMLREAKAMAQLSHPNVVPIYDVDADEGNLFLAMEYVQGDTLQRWLKRGHDWRAILDVFVEAGRGLAAAHAQGIVHRDFKPTNVIVGTDGRARVMDFGLARSIDGGARDASDSVVDIEPSASSSHTTDLGSSLTELGTVVGTPRYMAPEQHIGQTTDARTDQYAFCTALWEALYGTLPFTADSIAKLAIAKNGPPPKPPSGTRVPSSVQAILVRGLASDPQARWPDMDGLLAALRRAGMRRRSWWLAVPIVAAVGIGAFALARRDPPCATADDRIAAAWNDDARARMQAALAATGATYAASTWERVAAGLDGYASDWAAMHRDACEATKVRHEQSDEALDLRMACLDAREGELGAVIELLGGADAQVVENAIAIVGGMTPVARCADVAKLRQRVPPPDRSDVAQTVETLRAQLLQAGAYARAGRLDEAMQLVTAAHEQAATTEYPPAVAETELRLGMMLFMLQRLDEAEAPLEHALELALAQGMDAVAAESAIELAALITETTGKVDETEWLARTGLGLAKREGTEPTLVARAMAAVGEVYGGRELEVQAEPYFRGAVEHLEAELGPDSPELVPALQDWGALLRALERMDEATVAIDRAVRLAESAYGPDHPRTASAYASLGWQLLYSDRFPESQAAFDRALAVNEAAFGPNHPAVWTVMSSRSAAFAEQAKFDEAIAGLQDALGRMGDTLPADHPARAHLLHNLGMVHLLAGHSREGIATLRQAIDIRRRLGVQHDLSQALSEIGRALAAAGDFDEAQRSFEECDRLDALAHADDGMRSGMCTVELGKLALRRGEPKRALQFLVPGEAMQRGSKSALPRSDAAFALGQALLESGKDRRRGRELVEKALADIEANGHSMTAKQRAAEMRAWWEAHRG